MAQQIFLTPLPNGFSSGLPGTSRRRLSVAISPRLIAPGEETTKLSAWPDWVDWPATVSGFAWKIVFTDTTNGANKKWTATNVTRASAAPDSALWQKLFAPTTTVPPYKGPKIDLNTEEITSIQATQVQNVILGKYMNLARDKVNPPVESLMSTYEDVNLFSAAANGLEIDKQVNRISKSLEKKGFVKFDQDASPVSVLAQTAFFHAPSLAPVARARREGRALRAREITAPTDVVRPSQPPTPPTLDFNQGLGSLGNHPQLQRRLGLVVDLEFDLPASLTPAAFSKSKNFLVEVQPDYDFEDGAHKETTVRVRVGELFGGFEASSYTADMGMRPEVEGGLLRLGDVLPGTSAPEYDLIQLDTDGAAFKAINFASELARSQQAKNVTPFQKKQLAPPSLRSAGISVVRTARDKAYKTALGRQAVLNDEFKKGKVPNLRREDLTRGYVFDVFDVASGRWYSLCEREGDATFTAGDDVTIPLGLEEGWISTAISKGFEADDEITRIPPAVARWANGWSMVTQRPGMSVRDDETLERFDPKTKIASGGLPLAVLYRVAPNSLPPQRYGRAYMMRARAVDLAGNVITSGEATTRGNTHVLGPDTYRRYEPVVAPTLVMRKPLTEGESTDVIVIRSNYNTAGDLTAPADRHVYPPKIDQFRAEAHGMFDTEDGVNPDSYELIAARESGAFDARDEGGNLKHAGAVGDPKNADAPYYDLPQPVFQVEAGSPPALLPYLADPLARGFAFESMPGAARTIVKQDLYRGGAQWPNVRPIRLRIEENEGLPAPQAQTGDELRVHLAKGEAEEVRVSCFLREEDLDKLAVWANLSDADKNALRVEILNGQHWALTPQRTVRLIHAIRQPNQPAIFSGEFELEREPGQNFVTLADFMSVDNKSTDRIDINAEWIEVKDFLDPDDADADWEPTKQIKRKSRLRQIPVDSAFGPSYEIAEPHELGHTRHISGIAYDTVASSRFKDYFMERADLEFDFLNTTKVLGTRYEGVAAPTSVGVVPESETVASLDGKKKFRRGTHYTMDYGAGTISRVGNSGMDSNVRVTYVKGSITRTASPVSKRALNAKRPDPPKVLYAVPTFKRERTGAGNETRARHEPSGLRVYLDRPWWSSGDGEKLGVVLWRPPTLGSKKDIPEALYPYVTQRGQDPLWSGAPTSRLPNPVDFSNKRSHAGGLRLSEVPGEIISVAAHDVHPDMDRKLWFADIDILPGSAYTPFIKLALVRYQEHSLPGLELSTVVPLEFMQLYPSRNATVTVSGSTANVSVSGRTYRGGGAGEVPEHSAIVVTVEQRRPELPDGDDAVGWMEVSGVSGIELSSQTSFNGVTTWTGSINVPTSGRRRVVFREYEQFTPDLSNNPGFDRRLVYAEAIEV